MITEVITEEFDELEEARSFITENYEGDEQSRLLGAAEEAFTEDDELEERVAERLAGELRDSDDEPEDGPETRINPNGGEESAKAKVEGDRIPHWRERAATAITASAVVNASGNYSEIKDAQRKLNEVMRQNRYDGVADSQREEEVSETEEIIERGDHDWHRERAYKDMLVRRQNTDVDSEGGELLPRPFQAEIFNRLEAYGVARSSFRMINMSSKTIELKHVSSKPTVSWENEGARISDSDLGLDDRVLEPKKLAGITTWTNELQEDQAETLSILPVLQETYAEQFALEEDTAFFEGDGTSSNGGFTGLLNLSGATTFTMGTGNTDFSDITTSDLTSLRRSLTTIDLQGAEWFMNKDVLSHIEDETEGDTIIRSATDDNSPPRLYGHDVNLVEAMPGEEVSSSNQTDSPFVVLANPDRILMGQRRGLQTDTSTEGVLYDSSGNVTFSAFQEDSSLIRITERVGYAIPGVWEQSVGVLKTAS